MRGGVGNGVREASGSDVERPFVTVVSGLPRSGTSLMMQMLEAGGLRLLYDDSHPADEANPRGYYELAALKRLRVDSDWVSDARGKAVKVFHALLRALPDDLSYRVLWMERDLREVVRSQHAVVEMLGGVPDDGMPEEAFVELLADQHKMASEWLDAQPGFLRLDVSHAELLRDPADWAARVADFLGGGLDAQAMAGAVDPALHRQRI